MLKESIAILTIFSCEYNMHFTLMFVMVEYIFQVLASLQEWLVQNTVL